MQKKSKPMTILQGKSPIFMMVYRFQALSQIYFDFSSYLFSNFPFHGGLLCYNESMKILVMIVIAHLLGSIPTGL